MIEIEGPSADMMTAMIDRAMARFQQAVEDELEETAQRIADRFNLTAPEVTGALKRSVEVRRESDGSVVVAVTADHAKASEARGGAFNRAIDAELAGIRERIHARLRRGAGTPS